MLAVAVANVSQKPPVDLDKSSQFDDINIESGGEGGCGPGARKAQGPPGGPSDLSEDEKVKQTRSSTGQTHNPARWNNRLEAL